MDTDEVATSPVMYSSSVKFFTNPRNVTFESPLGVELLRTVQFNQLPKPARKHGLRPLIRHFIRTVTHLVRAAGRWRLDFAKSNPRLDWLYSAAVQLE